MLNKLNYNSFYNNLFYNILLTSNNIMVFYIFFIYTVPGENNGGENTAS
jgi:hypothetical protein